MVVPGTDPSCVHGGSGCGPTSGLTLTAADLPTCHFLQVGVERATLTLDYLLVEVECFRAHDRVNSL